MKVTIEIPDNLPQERLQQEIKKIETSLKEEAQFYKTAEDVGIIMDNCP